MQMKTIASTSALVCVVIACGLAGCGKEAEVVSDPIDQMEQSLQVLQQAEPQPVAVQPQVPPPQQTVPVEPAPQPVQLMNQAMTAYQGGNYQDAVTRLQRLRAQPVQSPQQAMAIQDALGAVMAELYSLAAQGDAKAQQAIDHYQKLQGH
jgi:hypothetical protein